MNLLGFITRIFQHARSPERHISPMLLHTLNCITSCDTFLYFADRASQYIYLNINQLDALNFIMSLFHASTFFELVCSSSGSKNSVMILEAV